MNRKHRNTICVEDAEVIRQTEHPQNQFVLRLLAPNCASLAVPGSFVHIQCDKSLPMRRPLSIMRADENEGWIEVLYKIAGSGLRALAKHTRGECINIMGPIGNGFHADPERPLAVMIGGGVGIPPLIFLGEYLASHSWHDGGWRPQPNNAVESVAFFGSELPFPFDVHESRLPLVGAPGSATGTIDLMEACNIPCRLASQAGFAGCYPGFVTELAREWLQTQSDEIRQRVTIFSCGPEAMLRASACLATEFGVPSQLCLEEFMACAVGGCAGCAVEIRTREGLAMKRVCVDGPVFNGDTVYPDAV
jgi:dihydroorotate dehydrogenase electron transfer subunit